MSIETETDAETTEFEMFGRSWSVPTRRHHKHIRATKALMRSEGSLDADDVAEIYLSPEQYADLLELNVSGEQLSEFSTRIAEALGMGDSGNSKPSPASS